MIRIDRRSLLTVLSLEGLAFLSNTAHAAPRARASRLLVLHLYGGVRSSATFLASSRTTYNPYGIIDAARAPFALGRLLDDHLPTLREQPLPDADYTLGDSWRRLRVPRLREITAAFSIAGTWDPSRGDHVQDQIKAPTGSSSGDEPGILTRVAAALAAEGNTNETPAFHIEPTAMFGGGGRIAQHTPVTLVGAGSLPGAGDDTSDQLGALTGHGFEDAASRARLDDDLLQRRAPHAKSAVSLFGVHRAAARRVGAKLAEPWINVASAAEASFGRVDVSSARNGQYVDLTNQMLFELFTRALGVTEPTEHPQFSSAVNVATAIRLLQLGSPAVCVEIGNFDFHSDELRGRELYRFLGRLWPTIQFLLGRIPDPAAAGKTMLDTTLIVTTSDFGRDPGTAGRPYNGGGGVDHGSDPSTFYLAHAIMGGASKAADYCLMSPRTTTAPTRLPSATIRGSSSPRCCSRWVSTTRVPSGASTTVLSRSRGCSFERFERTRDLERRACCRLGVELRAGAASVDRGPEGRTDGAGRGPLPDDRAVVRRSRRDLSRLRPQQRGVPQQS
jgi:hypothetical protein